MNSSRKWMLILSIVLLNACGGSGGGSGDNSTPPPDQQTPPPQQQTPATAPSIATQPLSVLVSQGQTVTLSVVANGTAPLAFQWLRNGQPIVGANNSSYIFSAARADDGAAFSVAIANVAGTITSQTAIVDVSADPDPVPAAQAPSIQTQPQPQIVAVGAAATFSVLADGASLTLQWRKNGTDIAGATGLTYITPATSLADSGAVFDVVISNSASTLISNAVLLTVNPLPLAAAPTGVDTDTQSYLVSMSTGSYTNPDNVGPQLVATQGSASIEAIPGAQTSGAPSQYDTTWAMENFYHDYFYSPLSVATQSLPLKNHSQALIEGFNLDRYDSGLVFNGSVLFETLLIGIRSDLDDIGIGHWKYQGAGQNGYFYGYQMIRGAYIVGEPAEDNAVEAITGATYSGFSYGGLEREHGGVRNFEELTAQASASYDATTHKVTISIHDFTGYSNLVMADFAPPGRAWLLYDVWANPYVVDQSPASVYEFTCTATVDPLLNFFSCNLANRAATATGMFKGKFYGPHGGSIGGTFALTGLLYGSLDDGVVGAIAVKR